MGGLGMIASDEFSQYYAELLQGTYDCVDRIVLNAFYPLGQTGGGVRSWWRRLYGDDSNLDDEHLREMAGTFSRRLHARQAGYSHHRGAGTRPQARIGAAVPAQRSEILRPVFRDQKQRSGSGMGSQAQWRGSDH